MKRLILVMFMLMFCSGCASVAKSLPTVLTSKEQMWTIPAGVKFTAIQKPTYPNLTEFVVTDSDLAVIYKGNLLELEKEANARAVKAARSAKLKGTIWGSIGSLLTILAGLFAKSKLSGTTKKKK